MPAINQPKRPKAQRTQPKRCHWCAGDDLYTAYHDEEWGVPLRDSKALFGLLQLEGMQAGLSWITILKKRAHMTKVFHRFAPRALVTKGPQQMDTWLKDPGLIRNRLKLSALITNAQAFLDYEKANGKDAFADLIWQHVNHRPVQNSFKTARDVPAETPTSTAMSKQLKKLGFRFVGPTICYAFMQSAGLVNDHTHGCFRRSECRRLS